jgi:glycine/D-amino acid oxidase-like deaminating enzyme
MDLTSGYPFSLVRYGMPYTYPKLTAAVNTDVLIIGGGISGALIGYHMHQAGFDCVIVDGRSIGLGSTCASTSLLQYEIDVSLRELSEKIGRKNAVRAYQLCKESIHKLGSIAAKIGLREFQYNRSLFYAAFHKDQSFLAREFNLRHASGFRVEYLGAADLEKEFNFTAPAAILSYDAAYADAYLFTHALHQYSIGKGLKVYDRTFVKKITPGRRSITAITEDNIQIKAKKVIYATGYEVAPMIPEKYFRLHSTYVTISEHMLQKPTAIIEDLMMWSTAKPYLYIRGTAEGRVIAGGRDEVFFNPKKRDRLIKKKSAMLVRDFHKLFPEAEFKAEFSWAGTFGATPDGLPYIGPYGKVDHRYFALGFGGNGITFSLIAAEILTDILLKKKNKDITIFSFERT